VQLSSIFLPGNPAEFKSMWDLHIHKIGKSPSRREPTKCTTNWSKTN